MSDLFAAVEEVPAEEGKRGIPGATILKSAATVLATQIMGKISTASANAPFSTGDVVMYLAICFTS